jgi:polygalacturonase
MKKSFAIYLCSILLFGISCKNDSSPAGTKYIKVDAPFEMPEIQVPDFTNCKNLSIVDFGAQTGNKELTSKAIALAIEKSSALGGGIVTIPEGEWETGKIHFKSNVNLHLEKGAILLFSDSPDDYLPPVLTSWEGMECYNYSPLIYAYECENVAITGQGELKAKLSQWESWFGRPPAHMNSLKRLYNLASKNSPVNERQMVNDSAHLRPHFIQFNRCKNILVEGVTITNSPFWTIHPYLSEHIVIRNIKVYAHEHNNDGVDPEMCQNMLIENCVFDQGDDAIAVKSGRNQDAWRLSTPTKNLVIKNCIVKNGHQLLAIGSELSGGIENIFMDSCQVVDGAKLFHLLYIKTNERRGGYVKNIYFSNISSGKIDKGIVGIETDVLYQWRDLVPTYERRLTPIKNIFLNNVHASKVQFISKVVAQNEMPVDSLILTKVKADTVLDKSFMHENLIYFISDNGEE